MGGNLQSGDSTRRYEVYELLGKGGMGEVHRALDTHRRRVVALKRLRHLEPEQLIRFKDEFRRVARVRHRNLVRLHELQVEGGLWTIAMEYIDGVDLMTYVSTPLDHLPDEDSREAVGSIGAKSGGSETEGVRNRGPSGREDPPASETLEGTTHLHRNRPAPDLEPNIERVASDEGRPRRSQSASVAGDRATSAAARPGAVSETIGTETSDGERCGGLADHERTDELADEPASAQPAVEHSRQALTPREIRRIRRAVGEVAMAIQTLHEAGLLHLDIKPGNVMVEEGGRVVVLDFGLVRPLEPSRVQEPAKVVGTPAYMAPEQAMGGLTTEATDWYALGGLLYKALTGQHAFRGTRSSVMLAKQRSRPQPPSSYVDGIPAELEALCLRLLDPDPEQRPTGSEVLEALGVEIASSSASLSRGSVAVGRDDELAALSSAARKVQGGTSVIAHVRGSSGIGKSRLLRRLLAALPDPEYTVLEGRCFVLETVPYNAFDAVIDGLVKLLRVRHHGIVSEMQGELAILGRLFPPVNSLLLSGPRRTDHTEGQEARRRGFRALKRVLQAVGRETSLVLLIDDAQWGDMDSGMLLQELFAAPDPVAMMFIGAYRDEHTTRAPLLRSMDTVEERGGARALHVELAEMSLAARTELAVRLLGVDVPSAVVQRVVHESGGNPLFIEELCHRATRGDASGEVTLEGLIRERLGALEGARKSLVEVLSVARQPLALSFAASAASLDLSTAAEALRDLEHERLLRGSGSGRDDLVDVYHDRIRECLLAALPSERAVQVSAALAETLASHQGDPEQLAAYFLAANDLTRAAENLVLAADQARRTLAFDHAATLLEQAVSIAPFDQALTLRCALCLRDAGRGDEAAAMFLRATEGVEAAPARSIRALSVEAFLTSGRVEEGTRQYRTLLREVGLVFPRTRIGGLVRLASRMVWSRLREPRALPAKTPESRRTALKARLDLLMVGGKGFVVFDPVLGSWFWYRILALAFRLHDPRRLAYALGQVAVGQCYPASPRALTAGFALLDRADRMAAQVEDAALHGSMQCLRGVALIAALDFEQSLVHLEQGLRTFDDAGVASRWERTVTEHSRLHVLCWRGDLSACFEGARAWDASAPLDVDIVSRASFRPFVALAEMADGQLSRARATLDAVLSQFSPRFFTPLHAHVLRLRVFMELYRGRPRRALANLQGGWRHLRRGLLLGLKLWRVEFLGLRAQVRAVIGARGDVRMVRAARRDVTRLRKEGTAWADASAEVVEASLCMGRDDAQAARRHLGDAVRSYDAAGMAAHAWAARLHAASLSGEASSIEDARAWFRAEGIRSPTRFSQGLVPFVAGDALD